MCPLVEKWQVGYGQFAALHTGTSACFLSETLQLLPALWMLAIMEEASGPTAQLIAALFLCPVTRACGTFNKRI